MQTDSNQGFSPGESNSEELFAKAFRVSPAALWISNLATGVALDVNDSFLQMTGYTRDEVTGQTTVSLGLWSDMETRKRLVAPLQESGAVRDMEFPFRRKSGEWREGLLSAEITTIGGEECILVSCYDITERKRAEEELNRYARRVTTLRELDKAIIASQSTEAIAREALHYLCKLLSCRRADVSEFDPSTHFATIIAVDNAPITAAPQVGSRFAVEDIDFPESYRRGEAQIVPDLGALPQVPEVFRLALQAGLRSCASIPLVSRGLLIGALNLWSDRVGDFSPSQLDIAYEVAHELALGIQNARLLEEVQSGEKELQALSHRLLEVQETERRHIARELHDEIGQVLTAVQLNIEALGHAPQVQEPGLQARLAESIELVSRALQQVRDLSLDLRPSLLDDLGLVSALLWYTERQKDRTGIDIQLAVDIVQRLSPDVETSCFRIVQEALTNIARHAKARHVKINLHKQDGKDGQNSSVELTIRDDGCGFDVVAARERARKGGSMGLLGMEERAELVGGRLSVESSGGRGTTVRVLLPIVPTA